MRRHSGINDLQSKAKQRGLQRSWNDDDLTLVCGVKSILGTESGILNDSKTEQSSDAGEAKAFHEKSQSLSPSCKYKYIPNSRS